MLLPAPGDAGAAAAVGEDLFFVGVSPNPARRGLNEPILDGGAVYAIDGQGRILDRR
ncbi:hypothetical protein JYJ95_25125 [Corallococcus exiguus]|uniref:hypothetical protein n=1 Tax=Corallococcus exiguus TaxID=83462 RepID=UPI001A8D1171|nr:hypothetical protein [Corallococcus exiguus]MBN8469803.1 hypothetical protein [Corallococcus exiguus]